MYEKGYASKGRVYNVIVQARGPGKPVRAGFAVLSRNSPLYCHAETECRMAWKAGGLNLYKQPCGEGQVASVEPGTEMLYIKASISKACLSFHPRSHADINGFQLLFRCKLAVCIESFNSQSNRRKVAE
jgi:hypothetical protein